MLALGMLRSLIICITHCSVQAPAKSSRGFVPSNSISSRVRTQRDPWNATSWKYRTEATKRWEPSNQMSRDKEALWIIASQRYRRYSLSTIISSSSSTDKGRRGLGAESVWCDSVGDLFPVHGRHLLLSAPCRTLPPGKEGSTPQHVQVQLLDASPNMQS